MKLSEQIGSVSSSTVWIVNFVKNITVEKSLPKWGIKLLKKTSKIFNGDVFDKADNPYCTTTLPFYIRSGFYVVESLSESKQVGRCLSRVGSKEYPSLYLSRG